MQRSFTPTTSLFFLLIAASAGCGDETNDGVDSGADTGSVDGEIRDGSRDGTMPSGSAVGALFVAKRGEDTFVVSVEGDGSVVPHGPPLPIDTLLREYVPTYDDPATIMTYGESELQPEIVYDGERIVVRMNLSSRASIDGGRLLVALVGDEWRQVARSDRHFGYRVVSPNASLFVSSESDIDREARTWTQHDKVYRTNGELVEDHTATFPPDEPDDTFGPSWSGGDRDAFLGFAQDDSYYATGTRAADLTIGSPVIHRLDGTTMALPGDRPLRMFATSAIVVHTDTGRVEWTDLSGAAVTVEGWDPMTEGGNAIYMGYFEKDGIVYRLGDRTMTRIVKLPEGRSLGEVGRDFIGDIGDEHVLLERSDSWDAIRTSDDGMSATYEPAPLEGTSSWRGQIALLGASLGNETGVALFGVVHTGPGCGDVPCQVGRSIDLWRFDRTGTLDRTRLPIGATTEEMLRTPVGPAYFSDDGTVALFVLGTALMRIDVAAHTAAQIAADYEFSVTENE